MPALSLQLPASVTALKRVISTGSIGGGTSAAITIAWAVPFADASYAVAVSVVDTTVGTAALRVHHIESIAPSGIVVRVVNDSTLGAKAGVVHAIAMP